MIVKMIQNVGNKMESQINKLEAQIEKIWERFNKDLEEIKNRQSAMNSIITEIKNTLEGTNNKINEAEQVSELEITEAGQNIEEQIKSNEDILRDLWDTIKHINIWIIGAPKEKRERKSMRKYLRGL